MLNVFQTKWFWLCVCSAICKPHHLLFHGWEDTLRFGNSLLLPSQLNSVERKKEQFSNFNLNHLFIVLKGFHYLVEKQSNSWTDMTTVTSYQSEITTETMYLAAYIYTHIYVHICTSVFTEGSEQPESMTQSLRFNKAKCYVLLLGHNHPYAALGAMGKGGWKAL